MRQAILIATLATSTLGVLTTAQDTSNNCDTFKCQHNSKCKSGNADFSPFTTFDFDILAETTRDGQHCECKPGHTGLQCNHKYEICDPVADPTFACFHGGTCNKHKDEWRCDCTTATFDGVKTYAAGNNCEVLASTICDESDAEDGLDVEEWFCTNGGSCRLGESDISEKCDCPSGYKGEKCQFKKGADVPECNLSCKHGGQCAFGSKDHKKVHVKDEMYFTETKDIDGMHCVCPEGYAGVQCEIKLDKCGGKYCYHGATCLKETDDFGGESHHCDCSTATDTDVAGFTFAGRYCEHRAETLCEPPNDDVPPAACANGGTCHEQPHMGCKCPSGWTGPFCEYKAGEEYECKLQCKHGGQCRSGIHQNPAGSMPTKFDLAIRNQDHINFEHCSCPPGYYGIDCSIKVKKCGEGQGEHVCANDSQCIATGTNKDGKIKWGCDCMGDTTAGQHCQHDATSLCVISGNPDDDGHSFCANGGKCVQMIKKVEERNHVACACPDGVWGNKCQYKAGEDVEVEEISTPKKHQQHSGSTATSSSSGGNMAGGAIFIVVAVSVVALTILVLVVRRKMNLRKHGKEELPAGAAAGVEEDLSLDTEEESSPSNEEESTGKGESMTTVEII